MKVGYAFLAISLLLYTYQSTLFPTHPVRAVYVDGAYSHQNWTTENATALLTQLGHPDHLYIFAAHVQDNGTLTGDPIGNFPEAIHNISTTKVLLAVGHELHYRDSTGGTHIKLNDTATLTRLRENIVTYVTTHHYDGVIMDFEPVKSGDQTYKQFLIDLKRDIGPRSHVGVYGFRLDDSGPGPYGDGWWEWTPAYYAELSPHVDSIQLALYNQRDRVRDYYGGYTIDNYQAWITNQTRRVHALGITNVYYGMSKFPDTPNHYTAIERIRHQWPLLITEPTFVFTNRYLSTEDYDDYYEFIEAQRHG